LYALLALTLFRASNSRVRAALHVFLIVVTFYGSLTVWTTPNLEMPWRNQVEPAQSTG
jgi:hypothetical protein